jgi:hypothetical protein
VYKNILAILPQMHKTYPIKHYIIYPHAGIIQHKPEKKNTFPIPFNLRSISIPKIPKSQKKIEKMFIFSPQRRRLRPGGLDAPARRVSPGQRREPCSVTDGGRGAALRRGCGAAAESILTKGYGGALGVGEIHGDTLRSTMGNFNSSKKHNSMPGSMFMEDDSPKIGISPRNIGGSQYT